MKNKPNINLIQTENNIIYHTPLADMFWSHFHQNKIKRRRMKSWGSQLDLADADELERELSFSRVGQEQRRAAGL